MSYDSVTVTGCLTEGPTLTGTRSRSVVHHNNGHRLEVGLLNFTMRWVESELCRARQGEAERETVRARPEIDVSDTPFNDVSLLTRQYPTPTGGTHERSTVGRAAYLSMSHRGGQSQD